MRREYDEIIVPAKCILRHVSWLTRGSQAEHAKLEEEELRRKTKTQQQLQVRCLSLSASCVSTLISIFMFFCFCFFVCILGSLSYFLSFPNDDGVVQLRYSRTLRAQHKAALLRRSEQVREDLEKDIACVVCSLPPLLDVYTGMS